MDNLKIEKKLNPENYKTRMLAIKNLKSAKTFLVIAQTETGFNSISSLNYNVNGKVYMLLDVIKAQMLQKMLGEIKK